MIYRGFNQNELNKITEILDRNGVQYHISVPDEAVEYINDKTKRVNHRFMDSLLQIEIEKDEFTKINPKDVSKLFDLRIYPEEESPFTEEELQNIEPGAKPVSRPDKNKGMNQAAALLALAVVTAFFLWKHGII